MSTATHDIHSSTQSSERPPAVDHNEALNVVVCVADPTAAADLIPHGLALVRAFGGHLSLLHALESRHGETAPIDPIEWDIHRRDMENLLGKCAKEFGSSDCEIDARILDESCFEQIDTFVTKGGHDTVVVLGESATLPHETGDFAQSILATGQASILKVPTGAKRGKVSVYDRIFTPVDGSGRAESVLPKALRLAASEKAELVLGYVAPPAGVVEIGVADEEAVDLRERVTARNRRVGESYLQRIVGNLSGSGVPISKRTIVGGDVRRSLLTLAAEEAADIIVMASHGQSSHKDVSAGDVATFILKRSKTPVLMLRQRLKTAEEHAFHGTSSEGVRQPADMKK